MLTCIGFPHQSCEKKYGTQDKNTLQVTSEEIYSVRSTSNLTIANIVHAGGRIEIKIPADNPSGDVFVTKSDDSRTIKSIVFTKLVGESLKIITINEDGVVSESMKPLGWQK